MAGRARNKVGAALAVGLAIGSAVALTSSSASGDTPPLVPFGTLTIEFGDRDGTVRLDYADPTIPDVTQGIVTQQPCAQVGFGPLAGGDLVSFTPIVGGATSSNDTVQLPDNAVGVNTGTNCGTPAGLIGVNELLKIELGSFLNSDPAAPDVFAKSASVVIDKKFNNDGRLTVGYNGGSQGSSIPVATGGGTISLTPSAPFTSVTFGSTSNQDNRGLSVGGPTVFQLVADSGFEEAVFCGGQVEDIGEEGQIAQLVTYVRAANDPVLQLEKNEGAPCQDVGVTVEIQSDDPATPEDEDRVFWTNGFISVVDGTTEQATVGEIRFTWAPAPASSAGEPTQLDYDADGPGGYVDAQFCESFSRTPGTEGDILTVDFPTYTGAGNIDGEAPWCVVSRSDVINGEFVERVETMVGKGDPYGRFR